MMSPPLMGSEAEGLSNISTTASSPPMECLSQNSTGLKERNYLGLSSDCSSVDSSTLPSLSDGNKKNLNLKATELRLGLPQSQSPDQEPEFSALSSTKKLDEKPLFPLLPLKDGICSSSQKNVASGNKRGFSDTNSMYGEGNWIFHAAGSDLDSTQCGVQGKFQGSSGINVMLSSWPSGPQPTVKKELPSNNHNSAPASKTQVVGWPPIRSFRKNSLATTSKANDEVDGKPGSGALFVKVSMDGAPYLRKVDLTTYSTYQELSSALERMFCCFTLGQCGSHGAQGRERMSESKLRDFLHGSEYVLTYEDKDGDWMLVGDVPWEMFIASCKRLKIMKGSDAIGLAPRTTEKLKNRIS